MANILRWPDEFTNQTPAVTFGPEFITFLQHMIASGAMVSADEHWSLFSLRRDAQIVDFIRRGRLGRGRPECWEVRLGSDGREVQLGRAFGIRDDACVVTAGLDRIRTVTELWLDGSDVESVLCDVDFWDKMSTSTPLEPPNRGDATDAR